LSAGSAGAFGPWTETVEALAAELGATAAARDAAGGSAQAERELIRQSGLLALAVPVEWGGPGASWELVLRTVRRLAQADSSLAHLFGFQHLQVATVRLFGTAEQQARYLGATVRDRWFWGNAVNSRDTRLTATRIDGGWRLDGVKGFCSGALGSDVLNVSISTGPEPTDRTFFVLPSDRTGLEIRDDWNSFGQRQTDSGTVKFDGVVVTDAERLGPAPAADTPWPSLRSLLSQSILTEIYLGNAIAALEQAGHYVRAEARPWAASNVDTAGDDPTLQLRAGESWASLQAAIALADSGAARLSNAYAGGPALTEAARAETAVAVASARWMAGGTALAVTQRVFELMGARSTAGGLRLDRYWRNVRVHTLHDPLDLRARELGRWALTGAPPVASAYS
jgi:alkylation response protein AidB-like acyl-CoA dehydrogenase